MIKIKNQKYKLKVQTIRITLFLLNALKSSNKVFCYSLIYSLLPVEVYEIYLNFFLLCNFCKCEHSALIVSGE